MQKTLVTSAVESESHLLPGAVSLGIGMVAAAAKLSSILARGKYDHVIFTGTCGVTNTTTHPIGDIIYASSVVLTDLSILEGKSFTPEAMPTEIPIAKESKGSAIVITCSGITQTDEGRLHILSQLGNVVENMEAFGIAAACQLHQVTCEIILGVTNRIGAHSHSEWQQHHKNISIKTQNHLLSNQLSR